MNVLVSGATGFVGKEVVKLLVEKGHHVYALTRNKELVSTSNITYLYWENVHTPVDLNGIKIDGIINLVGENIASSRWNNEKKKSIYNSRIDGTRTLTQSLVKSNQSLKSFVSTSAIGYYGSRKGEVLSEESSKGDDFMARVSSDWEKEAFKAEKVSERVSIIRLSVVLGKSGGLIKKILPLFSKGLGGKLSSGDQYFSWIHLSDAAKLYVDCLEDASYSGVYNGVSPYPVTNKVFTSTLGKILDKKTIFGVPGIMIKLLAGELSESILSDSNIKSPRLRDKKFHFRYPTIELALKEVVSKTR